MRSNVRPNWPILYPKPGRRARALKERSLTWLSQRQTSQEASPEGDQTTPDSDEPHDQWDLHIPMPTPSAPFTLAQTRTPGWDSPWSPRHPENAILHDPETGQSKAGNEGAGGESGATYEEEPKSLDGKSNWYRRKKKLRFFVLNHNSVPLVRLSVLRISQAPVHLHYSFFD